jgi:hypothetical protein
VPCETTVRYTKKSRLRKRVSRGERGAGRLFPAAAGEVADGRRERSAPAGASGATLPEGVD